LLGHALKSALGFLEPARSEPAVDLLLGNLRSLCRFVTLSSANAGAAKASMLVVFFLAACALSGAAQESDLRQHVSSGASARDCQISFDFRRAEPVDEARQRTIEHLRTTKNLGDRLIDDPGVSIWGVTGNYRLSSASTFADLKFRSSYVAKYADKIESSVIALAREKLCGDGTKKISAQITVIELYFLQDFDLEQAPRYGRLEYNQNQKLLSGVFVWNPRQILADQYWLNTNKLAPDQDKQITAEAFFKAIEIYVQANFDRRADQPIPDLSSIPRDLLWLFENSVQSTRIPFGAFVRSELELMLTESEPGYAALASELATLTLASGEKADLSLTEIATPELVATYTYRIDQ
jgi:hypothetical protein